MEPPSGLMTPGIEVCCYLLLLFFPLPLIRVYTVFYCSMRLTASDRAPLRSRGTLYSYFPPPSIYTHYCFHLELVHDRNKETKRRKKAYIPSPCRPHPIHPLFEYLLMSVAPLVRVFCPVLRVSVLTCKLVHSALRSSASFQEHICPEHPS